MDAFVNVANNRMSILKTYLIILLLVLSGCSYGQTKVNYTPPHGSGFILLELFTSEGCSSCPAADKTLVQLGEEYKHNFYTLEFHVDYWNYLGWKDQFSNSVYTDRQQHYASLFSLSSTYTPQVIINGQKEMVGSDQAKMRPVLNQCVLKAPEASLSVSSTAHMSKVFVAYSIKNTKGQLLNVALVQKKTTTNVKNGENKGRKLSHTNVVRDFKTIDLTEDHGFVEVYLPSGIVADECSVVAYTQKKDSREVTSVSSCNISVEDH